MGERGGREREREIGGERWVREGERESTRGGDRERKRDCKRAKGGRERDRQTDRQIHTHRYTL